MVGANVMVPRTKKGVITDMNGNFSLEVAAGDEVEISYLGYTTQKIKISAQNFLNVVLREDAKSLNEVVVVGYCLGWFPIEPSYRIIVTIRIVIAFLTIAKFIACKDHRRSLTK